MTRWSALFLVLGLVCAWLALGADVSLNVAAAAGFGAVTFILLGAALALGDFLARSFEESEALLETTPGFWFPADPPAPEPTPKHSTRLYIKTGDLPPDRALVIGKTTLS
jgi:hypothetical protein